MARRSRADRGSAVAKVRVYELAKEFGVESKAVMAKLQEMGEFVRSASSTIEAPVVRRLKEAFSAQAPKAQARKSRSVAGQSDAGPAVAGAADAGAADGGAAAGASAVASGGHNGGRKAARPGPAQPQPPVTGRPSPDVGTP